MLAKKPTLLVEDDLVDAMAAQRAGQDVDDDREIIHVSNGEEALAYLQSEDREAPFFILLDLNMPRMDGFEFLGRVKMDPRLSLIPIVVLTTSSDSQDIDRSFGASVAGYVQKPIDYREFELKLRAIEAYWTLNRLPGQVWEPHHAGH